MINNVSVHLPEEVENCMQVRADLETRSKGKENVCAFLKFLTVTFINVCSSRKLKKYRIQSLQRANNTRMHTRSHYT